MFEYDFLSAVRLVLRRRLGVVHDTAQGFGGCFDGKTQSQAIFRNGFDLAGRRRGSGLDLNGQKGGRRFAGRC